MAILTLRLESSYVVTMSQKSKNFVERNQQTRK